MCIPINPCIHQELQGGLFGLWKSDKDFFFNED